MISSCVALALLSTKGGLDEEVTRARHEAPGSGAGCDLLVEPVPPPTLGRAPSNTTAPAALVDATGRGHRRSV